MFVYMIKSRFYDIFSKKKIKYILILISYRLLVMKISMSLYNHTVYIYFWKFDFFENINKITVNIKSDVCNILLAYI